MDKRLGKKLLQINKKRDRPRAQRSRLGWWSGIGTRWLHALGNPQPPKRYMSYEQRE